jgi:hypothetical protein
MMRLGMSPRDQRTLVVGICIVFTLFAVARGVPAGRQWERAQRMHAQEATEQLASMRAGAKLLPSFRDSLQARARRLSTLDSLLLTGRSVADAAASLASTLEELATEDGLKIAAVQIRPDTLIVRSLAHVAVRITGTSDVTGLATFLHDVEDSERTLVVRELSVSQPDPVAPESKPEALRVELLVEGLALIQKSGLE